MSEATSQPAVDLQPALLQFGQDLHRFLERLPGEVRKGRLEWPRQQCRNLLDQIPAPERITANAPDASASAHERWSAASARVRHSLQELAHALDSQAAKRYLIAKHAEVARAYESWRKSVRVYARSITAEWQLKPLVPLVGMRTLWHISAGLLGVVMYQFILSRGQAVTVLMFMMAVVWSLELTRRMSTRWNYMLMNFPAFAAIARPREYDKVNSATWYLTALTMLTPLFSRPAVLTGVLILAFADPAAAWIGKRWGTRKLYGQKSVLGSLAFLAVALVASSAFLLIFYPDLSLASRLGAAAVAAMCGAAAELFTTKLDDNLTIPIAACLAASLLI